MNVKQSLLAMIKDGPFALMTDGQIARQLKLGRREALAVRDHLRALVNEGELLCDGNFRYGTAKQFGAKRGTISGNARGFAFFVPEDGSGDLFLPPHALGSALHGDTVLAFCTDAARGEGEVLAVLARGYRELVGTYRRERSGGYLVPDERKFSREIYIPAGKNHGCADGMKAVARIDTYSGKTPSGVICEVLGSSGDFFVEERAVIRAHGLREEFPDDVLREAEKQAARDPLSECAGREDLRDMLIVTIDGEDTRDIDDAVSVEKKNGKYCLGVHIADVSAYVKRGSALDGEAFKRGTSVYFPDRVLPMLPPALSNGICSLNEGEPRLTLSCFMTVDGRGNVLSRRVAPTLIRSRHRMTYSEVTAIAEGDPAAVKRYPDLVSFVKTAAELTRILQRKRAARGSVELDIKEAKIVYDKGEIVIPDAVRTLSHEMIEQFMVLANESVATLMSEKEMPFIYRVHERPSEEKAKDFAEFLEGAGIAPAFDPRHATPEGYKKTLDRLGNSPLRALVSRVMLRSMSKAAYSPENTGHFGLASERYCHFTSPIRRYPDLCIHRIIKDALTDEAGARKRHATFVRDAAAQSSLCERNAESAERDVDALYIVAYMQDKIGETYEAVISGVTSFGLFAELANTVEGLIPLETLPDDSYEFSETHFCLRGTRNSFRLGEAIRVKVAGVDWGARRVQFAFLEKCDRKLEIGPLCDIMDV